VKKLIALAKVTLFLGRQKAQESNPLVQSKADGSQQKANTLFLCLKAFSLLKEIKARLSGLGPVLFLSQVKLFALFIKPLLKRIKDNLSCSCS